MSIKQLGNRLLHNKTLRNGGLFSIYSFFNKGVSFVLLILLANYILPEQYGKLSLYNTCTMFLGYMIGLSASGYMEITYFKSSKVDFKKDFSTICEITVFMSLFLSFLLLAFHNQLAIWLKIDSLYLAVGLSTVFMNQFVSMNLNYLRITEEISKYGLLSCGYAVINFVLSLFLVIPQKMDWEGRIYAQFATEILFFIIAIICFAHRKLLLPHFEWDRFKIILAWSIPLIPHHLSSWLRQGADRYIIDAIYTTADVGLFSFALNLTNVIIMIGNAFNATNSVNLFQTLSSDADNINKINSLHRKERMILVIYAVASVIIVFGGVTLVPIFLPHYSQAVPYFMILSIYGFIQCMYLLVCNYLFYYNATKQLMYITFGCSVFHLILSLCLTRYSLYLTCVVYVISFLVMFLLVWKKSKMLINTNLPIC